MKKELWLRLQRYHFDNLVPPHLLDQVAEAFGRGDASTKAFASKLARKLGWSPAFAHFVIREYKKFLYLGVVSDFPVTPSKVIDQIWHEHLLFSRGYREFCRDVLQQDFDHNPELVPLDDQTEVFKAQYEATLDLYAAEFNMDPPNEVWGRPKFLAGVDVSEPPARRKKQESQTSSSGGGDTPLFMFFDSGTHGGGSSHDGFGDFGGGGGFSGGGGGSSWGEQGTGGDADASGSSDGGSSSDGGGSGCSSGCGGGGE